MKLSSRIVTIVIVLLSVWFFTIELNSKRVLAKPNLQTIQNGLIGCRYTSSGDPPTTGPFIEGQLQSCNVDATIDIAWAAGGPTYAMRWTGYISAPLTGSYNFEVRRDDGVRVWIDSELIIDEWHNCNPGCVSYIGNTKTLNGGTWYPIKVEYYNGGGGFEMELDWTIPGASSRQVIPTQYLATSLPIENVTIAGSATGQLNTSYTFNASISPSEATTPITYAWSVTDQSNVTQVVNDVTHSTSFSWLTAGQKTINLSVSNSGSSQLTSYVITIVPAAPTLNFINNSTSSKDFNISWSSSSGATGYKLEEDNNASFSSPTMIYNGSSISYGVTGQSCGSWYYRVSATNGGGDSAVSNTQSTAVKPDTPNLSLTNINSNGTSYTVDWNNISGATSYILQEDDNDSFSSPTELYNGNNTSHDVSGKSNGMWYYRVKAVCSGQNSDWSASTTVTSGGDLTMVAISGVTEGDVGGKYKFEAAAFPGTATTPIQYKWEATGLPTVTQSGEYLDTITLEWGGSGEKIVKVTANNGSAMVSDQFKIAICAPPDAKFKPSTPISGIAPFSVSFENISTGDYSQNYWDFGDGNNLTSLNPTHVYTKPSTDDGYDVYLKVSGQCNNSSNSTGYNLVKVYEPVEVDFTTISAREGAPPLTIDFTGIITGDGSNKSWDFGDGSTSNQFKPTHVYTIPGVYKVSFTVDGNGGNDTETKYSYIMVREPVVAKFDTPSTRGGKPPVEIQFRDQSSGAPTAWLWNFGNGDTSTEQNPLYTYTTTGNYTVTLKVTGQWNSNTITKTNFVSVQTEPVPIINADTLSGIAPLTVTFSSVTDDRITSYKWDFENDGTVDDTGLTVQHIYTQPGTFTAVLTVTGSGGSDSTSQIIQVETRCQAAFDFTPKTGETPLEINFDNQSTACQSYLWDFGDGTTSTEISPSHVFTPANTYVITLTATGTDNIDLMTKTVIVGDIGCYFTAEPTSGFRPLSVEFEAENCQPGTFFIWDFGDGTDPRTTYEESINHTYNLTGTFSVTMSSRPPSGIFEEDSLANFITVEDPPPTCVVDFSVSLNPPQPSDPPVTATFDNRSTDCVSYLWHFGDGNTSMEQNPVYTYTQGGVYTVSLVGNGTLTKSQLITIGDPIKPPAGSITVTIIPATANKQDDLEASITYLDDQPAGLEVRWSANEIPQPVLNNDFVVPAIFTENGDEWCVTVTPYNFDSTGKRIYGKAVGPICLFIENSPPEARNLRIRPDNPSTNDSLAVAYDYVDANDDPEGESKIRWYRGETLQSIFNDEKAIPSSTTFEGETWCVRVTPHDGKLAGDMVESCTSISPPTNGLPRITAAEIRPVPADETDTLQLFYLYEDPDNDPEGQTQIRWYRNRQYQPGFFGQHNIPASATNIGDEWFAIIRPHDGLDFGSPFETLPLKIITTSNIAPVVDEVTISPNRPGVDADLVLKYTISDLNDDPVSVKIRWFKNGIPQPTYNDQNSVPATATKLGDSWYAIIIPSDGDLDGDPVPARSVWVRQVTENSPPQALNVFLAPAQPGENQPLSFHYTYTDEDADQEGNTQISWQLNGQEQSALANQSAIPVAMTAKEQEWCVTVRPHDGYEYGETVASNCVTIGEYVNTNPVALNVEILPPLPTSSDDLNLSYTFFDPDNHEEGATEIKWYKIVNGVESYQAAFDGQTAIPAIVTAPGEQWYATVRPNDDQPSNGRGLGEMTKSSQVKINQPPTLEAATIIPAEPTEGQALVLRQTGFTDHDSDLSCPAQIRWSVNDDPRSEYDNQEIIPPGTITAGQVWQATVSPNDCLEYGLPVRTNVVTVTVCEGTCRPIGAIYLPILIRQQADNIPTPTPIPLGPYEENDVVAEAYGPLEFNQRYEAYAEDEHDWYTVSLSETTSLQIRVTNFVVSGMLAVYNSDLQLLATVEVTNQSLLLPSTPGSFILSNLPPGEYYLQIRATDELDMETLYHLELSQRPLSYEQPLR